MWYNIKKYLYTCFILVTIYLTVDFAAERWGNIIYRLYCTLPESLKIIYKEFWPFGMLWFNKDTKVNDTFWHKEISFGMLWFNKDTKGKRWVIGYGRHFGVLWFNKGTKDSAFALIFEFYDLTKVQRAKILARTFGMLWFNKDTNF